MLKRARGRKGAAKGKAPVERVAGERGTPKKEASKRGVGRKEAPEAVAPRVEVDAPGVGGEKVITDGQGALGGNGVVGFYADSTNMEGGRDAPMGEQGGASSSRMASGFVEGSSSRKRPIGSLEEVEHAIAPMDANQGWDDEQSGGWGSTSVRARAKPAAMVDERTHLGPEEYARVVKRRRVETYVEKAEKKLVQKRVDALCARYVAARDERDHLNDVLESLRIQIEQVVDSYSNLESDSEDSEESE